VLYSSKTTHSIKNLRKDCHAHIVYLKNWDNLLLYCTEQPTLRCIFVLYIVFLFKSYFIPYYIFPLHWCVNLNLLYSGSIKVNLISPPRMYSLVLSRCCSRSRISLSRSRSRSLSLSRCSLSLSFSLSFSCCSRSRSLSRSLSALAAAAAARWAGWPEENKDKHHRHRIYTHTSHMFSAGWIRALLASSESITAQSW